MAIAGYENNEQGISLGYISVSPPVHHAKIRLPDFTAIARYVSRVIPLALFPTIITVSLTAL